jgi:predicted membrane protein
MNDDKKFDAAKFGQELRDQIHRTIHSNLPSDDEGQRSRRPMVIGISLRGRGRGGIITGAILILIGLAFLLDHMGYIDIQYFWRFWPLLLVFAGLVNFLSRDRRAWGTLLILAGVLLQLNQLGITHFGWAQFWPMILIAVGVLVLWGALDRSHAPVVSSSGASDPRTTLNEAVVFGGLERRMTSQDFRGGEVTAIFGGVELDLTEASMQGNEITLAITAIFGGVELRVPPTWQVVFRGSPIFGGIEDKTRTPRVDDPANPNPKTLVVTGAVIFGGLEIKN